MKARWIGPSWLALAVLTGARSLASEAEASAVYRAPVRAVDVFDDSFFVDKPRALVELPEPIEVFVDGFEAATLDADEWGAAVFRRLAVKPAGTPVRAVNPETLRRPEEVRAGAAPKAAVPPTVGVTAERAHGGRQSLVFEALAPAVIPSLDRVIAVRPRTTYRFSALVFAEALEPVDANGVGASVELHELDASAAGPSLVAHQHLPRERGTSADWKKLLYTFRTSERTRHLRITVEAATGRATGRVYFDDLTIVEIPRLADLLESDVFVSQTRRGASHPMVKRVKVFGNDYRPAILAPAPTRWRWPVDVGHDTLLRFELGAQAGGEGSTRACFRVRWQGPNPGQEPKPASGQALPPGVLFDQCVHFAHPQTRRRWQEVALDLAPWAGHHGELDFETYGSQGAAAYWGNPRLVARKRAPGDGRPNIVLIVIDTLRADHLGIEGYARPTSPVLDQLARSSVRYSRAYSASPWTAPSMASLMTGRYPSQHHGGIRIEREQRHRPPARRRPEQRVRTGWENRLIGELFRRATTLQYHAVDADNPTLAERLRAAGYDTFGFHSNFNSSGAIGLSRGFDRYEMFSGVSGEGAEAGVALSRAVLSGRRQKGEEGPFFLMFHTQDPHVPYRLRRSQLETFGPAPIDPDKPRESDGSFRPLGWAVEFWDWQRLRAGRAQGLLDQVIALYDSEIAWADQAIGKLLEELDNVPDTVIVFTADHGEEFGDHGQFEHGHSLYDEVLRVPLFVRLPGGRHAGSVVSEPVATVDVAPTLLHLAGAEPLPAAEGRPLFAAGAEKRRRHREGIFAEAMLRGPERTAIIAGRYKYILTLPFGHLRPFPMDSSLTRGLGLTANVGREELFDLEVDPGEKRDLAARQPEVTGRLRQEVRSYLEESAHGIHVRCRGPRGLELEVASTATFAHVQPLAVEEEDRFDIDATRRRLEVRSGADESDDWWILRLLESNATVVVRASSAEGRTRFYVGRNDEPAGTGSLTVRLGDEGLAEPVDGLPDSQAPWCQVWHVRGAAPASSEALDSEIVDQLRALGYLG